MIPLDQHDVICVWQTKDQQKKGSIFRTGGQKPSSTGRAPLHFDFRCAQLTSRFADRFDTVSMSWISGGVVLSFIVAILYVVILFICFYFVSNAHKAFIFVCSIYLSSYDTFFNQLSKNPTYIHTYICYPIYLPTCSYFSSYMHHRDHHLRHQHTYQGR